jgi:dimethylamine monooxygenase subunit A
VRHTPYLGPAQPFTIGLQPLDARQWLEPDAMRTADLAEKAGLIAARPDLVIRSTPETAASEADMLARLAAHMTADHGIAMPSRAPDGEPPLVTASRHIQDDLVLMRKAQDGWRLAAACLCFPASWSLAEKFDRPMDRIHEDVPGWAGQMAIRVARIFDHLQAGAHVWRLNWSIDDGLDRHRPGPKRGPKSWRAEPSRIAEIAHIRVERQTLFKSPATGDILFTIRTYVDPLAAFAQHAEGQQLAAGLKRQLEALTPAQLAYKGLEADRNMLVAALDSLVSA